jgi:hypothetical protein
MTTLPSTAYVQFWPDERPEVNATVRVRDSSRMYCHTYPDSAPIVSIDDPPIKVAISVPDPDQVTDQDVQHARQLADLLARYIAELEHRAAAARDTQPGHDGNDSAGRAA